MKEPLFIIVHENCINLDMELHKEGKDPGLTCVEDYPPVSRELARIKREEVFREVTGDPTQLEYHIPEGTSQLWVCGAYGSVCVQAHVDVLKKTTKIPVEVHMQGTIFFNI